MGFFFYFQLPVEAQKNSIRESQKLLHDAEKLVANGNYAKALVLQERALAICEKVDPLGINAAYALLWIAQTHSEKDDYDKVLPLLERALVISEKVKGPEHPDTGSILQNLAGNHINMRAYAKALPLYERCLVIFEKVRGPDHLDTAACLHNLSDVHERMGNYTKALPPIKRCLAILEKVKGPGADETGVILSDTGHIYMEMGDYAAALAIYERSLAISEKIHGAQHMDTAVSLASLGDVHKEMGDYAKSLTLYERSLAIHENVNGADHPTTGIVLNHMGDLHKKMGDYAKALGFIERSLAINEKVYGLQHPNTAARLKSLGEIYKDMGDYPRALQLIERFLASMEQVRGPDHPDTAEGLNSLAQLYEKIGDYSKAIQMIERSLVIFNKVYGQEHPAIGEALDNLSSIYIKMGDNVKAKSLVERSLAIHEKLFGPEHPKTAKCLYFLAATYFNTGEYVKAIPIYQRALAIHETALGPQHPDTAASLASLANTYYCSENLNMSRMYASKALASNHRQLQSILSLDERARLSWQKENLSFRYACMLRADPLAELSLRWKGVVLDSLLEDRALTMAADKDPEGAALLDEMRALRGKLAKIVIEKDSDTEVANIEKRIGQIQTSLAKRANIGGRVRSAVDMTIDAVVPALTQGALLVDFIRFSDPKLKGDEAACYGAILTGGDATSRFVRIDGALAIDRAVDDLRSAIVQSNEKLVEEKTLFLSEKIWLPLSSQIPQDTKQLIICPEAKLNFLSFAALLDQDGHFIAEKYPISYVGSTRDLTRKSSAEVSRNLVIYAAPAFDATGSRSASKDNLAMRSAEADAFGGIDLPLLPGTEAEAKAIQSIANDVSWSTKVLTGHEATEASVRSTKKQAVLHLATHGFYLNSFTPAAPVDTRGMSVLGNTENVPKKDCNGVDPMRASGVALTGATQTLKQWSQRKAPESETDGILTADEVASLNLNGTWLVTLSACETGVGEARNGEGVFGLRRAFMMAGAENLLMTLWPVSDNTTAEIMASFYKEALTSRDAVGSLAKVQRDWLVKLRKEKGLLAAVRDAAPFAMVMMTAPSHPPVTLPQPIQEVQEVPENNLKTAEKTKPHSKKKTSWWPF